MSSSSKRASTAMKGRRPSSVPLLPRASPVPHRPFVGAGPALSSTGPLPPPPPRRPPAVPSSSTLSGNVPSSSKTSGKRQPIPDGEGIYSSVAQKAYLAYKDLVGRGAYLAKTPAWLLASSTAAVPAHQTEWAFRNPVLAAPSPTDAAALAEHRTAVKRVERLEVETHDQAVQDMDEKLHRVLKALPQSFAVASNRTGSRPSRLTMALALAREMAAYNLRPSTNTYRILLQICLAEQDDRLASTDALAIDAAAQRDRRDAVSSSEYRAPEADRLRRLFEDASWMERRPDLLAQHKSVLGDDAARRKDGAWYGSAEWEVAWGLYEDAKVRGVHLDREALNALLKLSFISPELRSRTAAVVAQAPDPAAGRTLADSDPQQVELLLAPHLRSRTSRYREPAAFGSLIADLDRVLSIYADFRTLGRLPTKEAVCQIAARLVRIGWSRAAVEMYLDFEKQDGYANEIEEEDWLTLLRGLCRIQHAVAMRNVWEHVVQTGRVVPDVGLIQDCQNLAGAAGLTDVAIECLDLLKARDVELAEHHYAPVVTAWTRLNDLEAAYYSLAVMRADGVAPLPETSKPILDLIVGTGDLADKAERELVAGRVDEAWYALLDSKAERGIVDVAAANVVMQACLAIADFVRATETFNEFENLGVTADLDTYHLLLDALLLRPLSSAELFGMLIKSLEDKTVAYTPATYERVIAFLCTQPKEVWSREAFTFMDDLVSETKRKVRLAAALGGSDGAAKTAVFGPTYRTFEVLLRRCVHERDERALGLQEQMRSFGFAPHADLVRELHEARLWTGERPAHQIGGEFDLREAAMRAAERETARPALPLPPRASRIRVDNLPKSEDGQIPPHVHDP